MISVEQSDTRIDSFFMALRLGQDSEASQSKWLKFSYGRLHQVDAGSPVKSSRRWTVGPLSRNDDATTGKALAALPGPNSQSSILCFQCACWSPFCDTGNPRDYLKTQSFDCMPTVRGNITKCLRQQRCVQTFVRGSPHHQLHFVSICRERFEVHSALLSCTLCALDHDANHAIPTLCP